MQYRTGSIVKGKVSGIQAYGAFVVLDDGTVGLIHISEISDNFVKDIANFVSLNEVVEVKVIDVDRSNNQLRLSLKALRAPSRRKNMYKKPLRKLPDNKIGFKSIEEKLEHWVQEAKNEG